MSHLFTPLRLREVTFKNRVFVAPMCQYSSDDGMPTDWHLVHLGARAVGGASLVIQEATAVSPEGRISPWDAGIWSNEHARAYQRITRFIREQGSIPGIQLAHAGRKASTDAPWRGGAPVPPSQGGWQPLGPSPIPFDAAHPVPREMTRRDIDEVVSQFAAAARRSLDAGYEVAEVHAAHGYLLHEFLSPLSNRRTDDYGGSLENRARLTVRVVSTVRAIWPARLPLFVRVSATDWAEGGWDLLQSVQLAKWMKELGVDLVDCSSGGNVAKVRMPVGPGYQVDFADAIRREAGVATGAVGMITDPEQAEGIVAAGKADAVLVARQLLRDPHWPLHAAAALGVDLDWPPQYARAKVASSMRTSPPPTVAR